MGRFPDNFPQAHDLETEYEHEPAFFLATTDVCGIDTFHTDKTEISFSFHASGSETPIKTDLNEQAPNYAWPDTREICCTNVSSESHIHSAS